MKESSRGKPQWTIPLRGGKRCWFASPEFLAWFRQAGPLVTNTQLQREMLRRTGIRMSISNLNTLRRQYGVRQSEEAREAAYRERDEPPLRRVRVLGPKDREHFVHVRGDALITGDWHVPYNNRPLTERLLAVGRRYGVRQLIINGDFLNEDAFSRHAPHAFTIPWRQEKIVAQALLSELLTTFEPIWWVLDNHDRRLLAQHEVRSEFTEDDLVNLIIEESQRKRVRPVYHYHWLLINRQWRVTCPREYRRVKLSLPTRLAQVKQQHIIAGGDHLFGLGVDDSARWVVANGMTMVDPDVVPYINAQDSTYPHWTPGFYMLKDDVLYPFADHPNLWPMLLAGDAPKAKS